MRRSVLVMAALVLTLRSVYAGTRDENSRSWQLEGRPRRFPRYLVEYEVCLLTCADTLRANSFANRLNGITDEAARASITIPDGFRRTNTLALRYHANSLNIRYELDPEPIRKQAYPDMNEVHFSFDKWNMLGEVPFVTVRAAVEPAGSINPYEPLKNPGYFLKPTPAWPVGSEAVADVLHGVQLTRTNQLTMLHSLLQWLHSESGIRQGLEPEGQRATRYGVQHTLEAKRGNCWDFSDLFVTLCRSTGLPCRQVAGWQLSGGGHVWAEVYLDNIGWLQVNPTTGSAISGYYLPLFTTSDGNLSYVFRSLPAIRETGAEQDRSGRRDDPPR